MPWQRHRHALVSKEPPVVPRTLQACMVLFYKATASRVFQGPARRTGQCMARPRSQQQGPAGWAAAGCMAAAEFLQAILKGILPSGLAERSIWAAAALPRANLFSFWSGAKDRRHFVPIRISDSHDSTRATKET